MGVCGTFIRGGAGRILVVTHEPPHRPRRTILVVPAFGEEMNKSRRLVAETGALLAARGIRTVVPDLFGTGDSDGELAEATWDIWIEDLVCTLRWARERRGEAFDLLLVRFGAALLSAARARLGVSFARAVAWHPVGGAELLKQLLRMKSMAAKMNGGRTLPAEAALQALLVGPEPTDLGGYLVSASLARAVHGASFAPVDCQVDRGLVIELAPAVDDRTTTDQTGDASSPWRTQKIAAERFWLAVEPRQNLQLTTLTSDFFAA